MISVSPLVVEDVEVVTLELEEASAKVVPALEQVEDEEEDDIVEVGSVIIIIFLYNIVVMGIIIIEIIIIEILEVGMIIVDIIIIEIVEVGRVRRRRTVRRSTGVGGKAPHLAINFRFGTWRK